MRNQKDNGNITNGKVERLCEYTVQFRAFWGILAGASCKNGHDTGEDDEDDNTQRKIQMRQVSLYKFIQTKKNKLIDRSVPISEDFLIVPHDRQRT